MGENEDEEIEQKRKMEDDAREQQRRDEDDAVDQKRQREDEARMHRHENEDEDDQQDGHDTTDDQDQNAEDNQHNEDQEGDEGQQDEHSNPEDLKSALQDLENHMGDSEDKPLVREEQRLVAQAHTKLNARDFENAADLEAQLKDLMQQRQVQAKRALRGHPAAVNAL